MLTVRVKTKDAEKVKNKLIKNGNFSSGYRILKKGDFVYFPVNENKGNYEFVDVKLTKLKVKPKVKDLVKNKFSKGFKTSMEVVGAVAIVEVDKEKDEKAFAKMILDSNPNVETVLNKAGIHTGEFRTQKMKIIGGKSTKEAVHKENNVKIKLNVEQVYFSARLSTE